MLEYDAQALLTVHSSQKRVAVKSKTQQLVVDLLRLCLNIKLLQKHNFTVLEDDKNGKFAEICPLQRGSGLHFESQRLIHGNINLYY